ncbi:MAG: ParB/RepB/Spo0J family partition protein [Hyphomicrobiales bacterium]|nr:ParB/RepB/Spo0J family partition protein [Hyphomicrobiales bacterium]
MAEESRPRLGRGLAALMGETAASPADTSNLKGVRSLPIEFLRPNPRNPRRTFDEEHLESLSASIKEKGILQPIIARAIKQVPDAFEIIAGERRWRAAQRAGLHELPVLVVEATDREALEFAIIENVQRADLNAIEEALGYEQLMSEFQYNQTDLSKVIGKSRSHIANTLRLMKLPDSTRQLVVNGALTAGHARALLSVADPDGVAKRAIERGLSVRDLEQIAQNEAAEKAGAPRAPGKEKDPNLKALEKTISDSIGLAIAIERRGDAGRVTIQYKSLEQLDYLLEKLK